MTDNTVRDNDPRATATWLMRGRSETGQPALKAVDPVVTLRVTSQRSIQGEPPAPTGDRDWSSSLDLIHEATEAIRISEERAADLEQELDRVTAQGQERARLLEAQVAAAERRTEKAEERTRMAEKRASEAEAWLVRLHDAIVAGFTRPAVMPSTNEDDEDHEPANGAQAFHR
ncbi:hypothetical protein [uncultured Methylobacterium sp.]|uniref:hypothetical protein n=1 Tax=uncultured Methylobacterium sp. TaxID=157278 RepID=UPI0035C99064